MCLHDKLNDRSDGSTGWRYSNECVALCLPLGIDTDTKYPPHLDHIRKLHQAFGMSRVGCAATRVCEKRSQAGVKDNSSNTMFDTALTRLKTVDAVTIMEDPTEWMARGNNGMPQNLATFSDLIKQVESWVSYGN